MNVRRLGMVAAGLSMAATAALAQPWDGGRPRARDSLSAGERLNGPNGQLVSAGGRYTLDMQGDCNLVIYEGRRPVWASGTHGRGMNCYAEMQQDGNLVVYTMARRPVWATGTHGRGGNLAVLTEDGRLVVTVRPGEIWASAPGRPSKMGRP